MTNEQLALACEAAGPEEQPDLLTQAFAALDPSPNTHETYEQFKWAARSHNFDAMLAARAFLSAAELLVPEGWPSLYIATNDAGRCHAEIACDDAQMIAEDMDEGYCDGTAATPALALTAACLRCVA